jgi:uncharacterized protein
MKTGFHLAMAGTAIACATAFAQPDAEAIMTRNYLATKYPDSRSDAHFRLINKSGMERVRETTGETKLIPGTTDTRRLVTFNAPADIKGTKTLLIERSNADDDIWIYLPALKKVRRLVANNKKDAFVGTDFSYGDVIGHKVEAWNHKWLRDETVDGRDCHVILSTPKTRETADNSGYSKRISWIDKKSSIAVKGENFDAQEDPLLKITGEDIRQVDAKNDKWQAMKLTAENVQTGHKTVIEFTNFKANIGVKEDAFTTRNLER